MLYPNLWRSWECSCSFTAPTAPPVNVVALRWYALRKCRPERLTIVFHHPRRLIGNSGSNRAIIPAYIKPITRIYIYVVGNGGHLQLRWCAGKKCSQIVPLTANVELMRMGLYNYDLGLFENRVPGNSLVYQPSEMFFLSGWTHFQTNPFGELWFSCLPAAQGSSWRHIIWQSMFMYPNIA